MQWAKLGKTVKPRTDPDTPELPDALSYLWEDFIEISSAVTSDDCGGPEVTWTAIQSWSELMGVALEKWEIVALTTLGRIGQSVAAKAFADRLKK